MHTTTRLLGGCRATFHTSIASEFCGDEECDCCTLLFSYATAWIPILKKLCYYKARTRNLEADKAKKKKKWIWSFIFTEFRRFKKVSQIWPKWHLNVPSPCWPPRLRNFLRIHDFILLDLSNDFGENQVLLVKIGARVPSSGVTLSNFQSFF